MFNIKLQRIRNVDSAKQNRHKHMFNKNINSGLRNKNQYTTTFV